ncbi:MAG: ATP-binding protein, partial [Candidatus Thermoplasmatota archaeon]
MAKKKPKTSSPQPEGTEVAPVAVDEAPDINAMPTKGFFIDMLTKDIGLVDAIIDLVDNSIDGARRHGGPDKKYHGKWVNVVTTKDEFRIEDNCGGIGVENAKKKAFRLGRDKEVLPTKGSIGQFGVGMKRAIFKIGELIEVESRTKEDQFKLTIRVPEWSDTDVWGFNFDEAPSYKRLSADATGTTIRVTELDDGVAEEFQDNAFLTKLRDELQSKQYMSVNRGLEIKVNGQKLKQMKVELLLSQLIVPMKEKFDIGDGEDKVSVEIIAGLRDDGQKNPTNAGWYVYCNGRAILEADQSPVTGWGEGNVPYYHSQFSKFRGYAFLEAENSSKLPWNTTKTGVEMSSEIYQRVRRAMVKASKPVLKFTYDLDR